MLVTFLCTHWKKVISLVVIIGLITGSFFYGRSTVTPKVEEKIVERQVVVEKEIQSKSKTKVKITKPDGTVIEKEVEKETKVSQKKTEKESSKETRVVANKPDYRLGVLIGAKPTLDAIKTSDYTYSFQASRRLIGDLWMDAQYNFTSKHIALGMSWQF